jgi:hypothetical protein
MYHLRVPAVLKSIVEPVDVDALSKVRPAEPAESMVMFPVVFNAALSVVTPVTPNVPPTVVLPAIAVVEEATVACGVNVS